MLLATRCGLFAWGRCLKLAPNFARSLALSVQRKYRHGMATVQRTRRNPQGVVQRMVRFPLFFRAIARLFASG
jgi:hypothetical protein